MGSVDDALAAVSDADRRVLARVIAIATELAPDAEQGMSYGMPALRVDGRPYVAVAAMAKHLSLFPFSPAAIASRAGRLEGYSVSKGTVRFSAEHPLPDDAVRDLAAARLAEIRAGNRPH